MVIQKSTVNGNLSFSELATYPYELLCQKTELPDGVDPSHKEVSFCFTFSSYIVSRTGYLLLVLQVLIILELVTHHQ